MAERLPRHTAREVLARLRRAGWQEKSRVGSHAQLTHPIRVGKVTVPVHQGATLDAFIMKKILKQAGLTVEEYRRL